MPQLTTPVSYGKWQGNKCSNKAGGHIRKAPVKHPIWISPSHALHCLSKQKTLWKRMNGSALLNRSPGFSGVWRLKSPCLQHNNCEALPVRGGEILLLFSRPVIKSYGMSSSWLSESTIYLKESSI
jgi:hypothetical protein